MQGLKDIAERTPLIIDPLMRALAMAVRHRARQIVPVESGHLRQGIRYQRLSYGRYVVYAFTKWGDVKREYAMVVHEALQYRHAGGKGAKYIEIPIEAIADTEAGKLIAEELLKRMKDGASFKGAYKVYENAIDEDELLDMITKKAENAPIKPRKPRKRT
jgi:hypothetical protein